MTMVLNLETGEELWFRSCSPEEAVVCAYNQSRHHNNRSYDYRMAKKSKTGKTVSCGNFAAVV